MSDRERNKRLVRELREESQRNSLPSALPGASPFQIQTPLGSSFPDLLFHHLDGPDHASDDLMQMASGFPSQAMGPTFLSYGPMIADGDLVMEEWESFIFGSDGTVYNNQYCWTQRVADGRVVEVREFCDSHHAWVIFGNHGGWKDLQPPTKPRRRSRVIGAALAPPPLDDDELDNVLTVEDDFELDPRLLCDERPNSASSPISVEPGPEGNKALVRALRTARAAGDIDAVNSFFGEGFRHFIAGEPPFGWDHLPLEQIYAPLVAHLAGPIRVRYGPPLADGDTVFEEMEIFARLDDGTVYNNWHAVVHEVRDGRIVQTREYLDTRHVWVVLGRWAPWGQVPTQPRRLPRRSNLQAIHCTTQTPTMFLDLERWRDFGPPT